MKQLTLFGDEVARPAHKKKSGGSANPIVFRDSIVLYAQAQAQAQSQSQSQARQKVLDARTITLQLKPDVEVRRQRGAAEMARKCDKCANWHPEWADNGRGGWSYCDYSHRDTKHNHTCDNYEDLT